METETRILEIKRFDAIIIDPHDFGVKLNHAIDFLCEDMKVKVTLKFRGREMAHKEFGFQQVRKFITDLTAWGHPDFEPKLIGKGINVMISPLPRNKRARHPQEVDGKPPVSHNGHVTEKPKPNAQAAPSSPPAGGFANNPFAELDSKVAS